MTVSLEVDYFKESMKYDRINLVCGGKGSGKTHFLTQFIKYSMSQKRFSKYYLLLPSFKNEADGAYEFLKVFSNVAHILSTTKLERRQKIPNIWRNFFIFYACF